MLRLRLAVVFALLACLIATVPAQAAQPRQADWWEQDDDTSQQQDDSYDDPWQQPQDDTQQDDGYDDPWVPDEGDTQQDEWSPSLVPDPLPTVKGKVVAGKVARMRADGKAAIPHDAPKTVRTLIRAANQIVGKPYKWGGGHAALADRGYDCSGAVSYALIKSGLLVAPQVSGTLATWAAKGDGRWISVYANKGHVYLEVAGLRLDTSSYGDTRRRNGVRWRAVVGKRSGFAARHPVGF